VEGPIQGGDVALKSQAHVVGDIHHQNWLLKKAPILMVARNRLTEPTDVNQRELAKSFIGKPAKPKKLGDKFRHRTSKKVGDHMRQPQAQ
jgi:hypothetical protein